MKDERFIRGDIPMTKEEVRAVSIGKLELRSDSILYDIGAGTGSVSVESALMMPEGMVYSIERKAEGAGLIKENSRLFNVENIAVMEGEAPAALAGLPAPTHAFLGGSGGKMEEILDLLLDINSQIRIVINIISLESLGRAVNWLKKHGIEGEIVQISVSRSKVLGACHMMMGQNPVYVISFGGDR